MAAPPKECPFAKAGELVELAKEKCPAFQEGCPFSETKTPVEIGASLQKMPPSHTSNSHAVHAAVARTRANSLTDQSGDDVLVDEWLGWWASHTDVDIENQISSDDGLASRLKKGTEQAHEEAENVAFVKLLLKGKAPLESYVALIAALKPIYGALEKAADRVSRTCPAVARVCDDTLPQLRRYESLEADLTYYRRRCPDVTKRAEAFARAIESHEQSTSSLDSGRPATGPKAEALVAHLYTRYLGDLSGGQILRRAAVRAYGLTPPGGTTLDAVDGVRFYDFRLIGKPTKLRRFKDEYRRRLDDLRVADGDLVVDEAVAAFRRNTQLLKELDFVVLGATEAAARHARPTKPKAQGQCPFLAKEDIAALPFKECPVTGESVSASRASPRRRFNAADIAVVAFFALGMVIDPPRDTRLGVMLPGP